jgi:hypothetical protein
VDQEWLRFLDAPLAVREWLDMPSTLKSTKREIPDYHGKGRLDKIVLSTGLRSPALSAFREPTNEGERNESIWIGRPRRKLQSGRGLVHARMTN